MFRFNLRPALGSVLCLTALAGAPAMGDEIVIQNDTLTGGSAAAICPCFTAGEEAAVWLTSPCDGNIVAIQVFWRSFTGGGTISLEDSIIVYNGGVFPNPGSAKDTLDGPALNDGVLNEYRYKDENQTIPISIPVVADEEFVVSFRFANTNNQNVLLPSIVSDGLDCQPMKNAVKVNGTTWTDACSLGVSGDWVIRAVVDCEGEPTGSACLQDGTCADGMTEADAITMGAVWNGAGSTCAETACVGACYIPATEQCVGGFSLATCDQVGGDWQGPGTDACAPSCPADLTEDGVLDFFDVSAFLDAFGAQKSIADFTGDGVYDFFDVSDFLDAFGAGC